MRKFNSILAICMVMVLLFNINLTVSADETLISGDYSYLVSDDEVTIIGYSGADKNVVVPSEIDGYEVTYIGDRAFKGNEIIESVVLPDTLYKVGISAFEACDNLKSVSFGTNTKWVATRAFADCKMINEIQLPDNIKILGSEVFTGTGIDSIYIPESLIETHYNHGTGNGPFGETEVKEVIFGNGATVISRGMFAGADSLNSIEIPDTIIKIGDYAFEGTGFSEIAIPDSVNEMGMGVFKDCVNLKVVKLSESLEEIENWMFVNSGLESLNIPGNVKEIGGHAFENCDSLKSIKIPNTVMSIGSNCFENCDSLEEAVLSNSIVFVNKEIFLDCSALKEIIVPYKVAIIDKNAFAGCSSLERVVLPRNTGEIRSEIFDWDAAFTMNSFSETVKAYAKYRGYNVESVEIPAESVEVIDYIWLKLYQEYQLILDINPIDFTDSVLFESSDESLVKVTETGQLIASDTNSGTATVTITVGDIVKVINVKVGPDMGDVNVDYILNAEDALLVLKHSADVEKLPSFNKKFADINEDAAIDSEDALDILKVAAGLK